MFTAQLLALQIIDLFTKTLLWSEIFIMNQQIKFSQGLKPCVIMGETGLSDRWMQARLLICLLGFTSAN